MENEFE
jgi:hypothetical protein